MMPPVVAQLLATMALLGCLSLAPVPNQLTQFEEPVTVAWEPEAADVVALARTLWGECRGCSELQQRAVCWCIFNRVDDDRFPDTVLGVVSQPSQFFGYKESFPITKELEDLARQCLIDWHNGENRVFGPEYLYFTGDGQRNHFTTTWGGGEEWCEG